MAFSFSSETVQVASRSWAAGQYLVIDTVIASPVAGCSSCESLRLLRRDDGVVLDEVTVPQTGSNKQYAALVPDSKRVFALMDAPELTLGASNVDLGPIVRIFNGAGFGPRDSSSNAVVQYEGHYWVLGGWSNFAHDDWHSVPDVWKSRDGVTWQLVNASPPYSRYSAFFVFQNRIWALGYKSYSSSNGVDWRLEPLVFSQTKWAVVFNGAIFGLNSDTLLRSNDGKSWTAVRDQFPWGPNRREPSLLVHRDRLWLIGGTDEPAGAPLVHRNDVWSSADGVTWSLFTANAECGPRRWQSAISHDGLLWVMNGANFERWPDSSGNVADIWVSVDGATLRRAQVPHLWNPRHASFVVPSRDGGFILAAGYGNGGLPTMYSDVWRVEFRPSLLGTVH